MDQPWKEYSTADGRKYWYNTINKTSTWQNPFAERAQTSQVWKEYTAEGGRKYWYNVETKASTWQNPYSQDQAPPNQAGKGQPASNQAPARTYQQAPTFVAGGTSNFAQQSHHRDRDDSNFGPAADRPANHTPVDGTRGAYTSAQTDPDYSSFEEAEAAFMKLLKRSGVQPDWTWEQTMRATIKDPQYRALKDPKDRKTAFEKYVVDVRLQEKDRAKERLAKLRADFGTMLRSHPEIKYYTRWKTARPILEGETIFKSAGDDNERRQLFEEYIVELKKNHAEKEVATKKAAMDELLLILKRLDLEPYTRWSEAQNMIQNDEQFQGDEKFKSISKLDILKAFENHIKALERSFNDARQQQKIQKARRERRNRDQFLSLLRELKSTGKIKPGVKWMQIHPLIEDDPRYVAMLGQSGSTPLDLFWDMIEDEERVLRGKRNEVLDVLEDKRYEITNKTTYEEFLDVMKTDRRTANIDDDSMTLIFERLRDRVLRRSEEEKHHAERHQRRAVDALRSRIKHLEPPVQVGDTWEQVRARVEKCEEYRVLDSDELRRSAFDKFMRRLKEKEEDLERERNSKRDHRDRDRERERDPRNGHSARDRHRRTRTPEPDAYEADRKRAQADRERQYRKSSATGLSPPHRHREDRDRYERGSSRQVSLSHYDRERREREAERERSYLSRADPRDKGSELDYGDSRAVSVRRRRESDAGTPESRRDSKRTRRDKNSRERTFSPPRHRSRTPAQQAPVQDEPSGMRSGSEEGEIEED